MTERMRTSRKGFELIKSFEGFRAKAARLPGGGWTIGYGHVRSAREGVAITERDAEDLLRFDLIAVETVLADAVLVGLNQNQFDALASFVFNISPARFVDSEVLSRLNSGDALAAAASMDAWRKARVNGKLIVVDALVRRRAIEKALFLDPPGGRMAAPTPLISPEHDLAVLTPLGREALTVTTPLTGDTAKADVSPPRRAQPEDVRAAILKLATAAPSPVDPLPPPPPFPEPEARVEEPAALQLPPEAPPAPVPPPEPPPVPLAEAPDSAPAAEPASPLGADLASTGDKDTAQRPHAPTAVPEEARVTKPSAKTIPTRDPAVAAARAARILGMEEVRRNAPTPVSLTEADAVRPQPAPANDTGRKPVIDDTLVWSPPGDPSELFAAIEADQSAGEKTDVLRAGFTPWVLVALVGVLALGLGGWSLLDAGQAGRPTRYDAQSALLVFGGVLLPISLYYIASGMLARRARA